MYLGAKRRYINTLPFLSFPFLLLYGLGCNFGEWYGCPLVVHYLADLQSVHGYRCCDNSAGREMSTSACTHSMAGYEYLHVGKYYIPLAKEVSTIVVFISAFALPGNCTHSRKCFSSCEFFPFPPLTLNFDL